ncbi:MAG: inositol monophosphatase [Myxococcales bacterium]|nr:inositol monophosphatase [Myxococcales bacterium]
MSVPGADGELGAELVCAIDLARAAGAEVVRMRKLAVDVEMKPGDEPVTLADKRASDMILTGLAARFPKDPVISEEAAPTPEALSAPRVWLVDPIDGTKDYIKGTDGFSVMIGIMRAGRPVLGVVYQPTIDRLFYATPDGAYVATAKGVEPLHVSNIADVAAVRFVASASHRSVELDRVKTTLGIDNELNVGSVGVKLCLIALGVRDLYVNPASKTKAWDTCAPEAILHRAGGRLSDLFGAPIDYHQLGQPSGLVASNRRVHDDVIAKLAPLFAHLRPPAS